MQPDLFADEQRRIALDPGAALLGGFALGVADALIAQIAPMARVSPFRHMETRGGKRMSVAMFNSGTLGWVSDRSGYRYDSVDPETGAPWPPLPSAFEALAASAADTSSCRGRPRPQRRRNLAGGRRRSRLTSPYLPDR